MNLLKLDSGSRVLLPLGGKTLDISWLLTQGYRVVGVELSEIAIQQLFDEMGVHPEIVSLEKMKLYRAENLDILVGNILDVTPEILGSIDTIFDRGSLVALPDEMRREYARHLQVITDNAPQLIACYEYDQDLRAGPPFSISLEELNKCYANNYKLHHVESIDASSKLGVDFSFTEQIWIMQPL